MHTFEPALSQNPQVNKYGKHAVPLRQQKLVVRSPCQKLLILIRNHCLEKIFNSMMVKLRVILLLYSTQALTDYYCNLDLIQQAGYEFIH